MAAFCATVGIEKPVVVGHSLGGMIAVELAARYPDLPSALVLVDPGPIDPLPETVEFFRGFAERLEGPDGEEVRRAYVADMGAHDDALARWIVELMCASRSASRRRSFAASPSGTAATLSRRCSCPVLLLRTGLWAETDVLRLLAIKPDLEVGITVGAGHFHQLEVPEQVNAMIERFLALSL